MCNGAFAQSKSYIIKKHEIRDGISPKSVVSSGSGLFAAQNMMYRHTVTIYNSSGDRLAKISDAVNLRKFGFKEYENEKYRGGPVEAAFTADGKFLWVSNYSMIGTGFEKPGCDACIGKDFDPGFIYKINCSSFEIESVIKVGAVPKYISISDDQQTLIVSNWTSSDISIVDLVEEKVVETVSVGAHPRGIDITHDGQIAYITIMGSTKIAKVDLESYDVDYIRDIGRSPRHLILSNHDSLMYVSLNSGNKILQYNCYSGNKNYCKTPSGPRSMCISPDGDYLYCVNYFDHSFSKISTAKMEVVETIETSEKPIGICANWELSEIWVACYSGKIEIFKDFHLDSLQTGNSIFGFDLSSFWPTKSSLNSSPKSAINEIDSDTVAADIEIVEEIVPVLNWSKTKKLDPSKFPKKQVEKIEGCSYHVICGSFSILENAHKRKADLVSKGYAAEVIIGSKLNYVSSSCHLDRPSALIAGESLKSKDGFSSWILKR